LRTFICLLFVFLLLAVAAALPVHAQKQMAQSPIIQSATTVYFDNCTGSDAVGKAALAQLKEWRRFQIVPDKKQADLIFLLSADPYHGGYIIFASGQTGTIDPGGIIHEDAIPNYNRQSPVRDAYLTVIDPKTGNKLWSDSHVWGGLLTGANSVGARLVKKLQSQMKK